MSEPAEGGSDAHPLPKTEEQKGEEQKGEGAVGGSW